jgi:hypothetical protein
MFNVSNLHEFSVRKLFPTYCMALSVSFFFNRAPYPFVEPYFHLRFPRCNLVQSERVIRSGCGHDACVSPKELLCHAVMSHVAMPSQSVSISHSTTKLRPSLITDQLPCWRAAPMAAIGQEIRR